jgi:hypothetical protein
MTSTGTTITIDSSAADLRGGAGEQCLDIDKRRLAAPSHVRERRPFGDPSQHLIDVTEGVGPRREPERDEVPPLLPVPDGEPQARTAPPDQEQFEWLDNREAFSPHRHDLRFTTTDCASCLGSLGVVSTSLERVRAVSTREQAERVIWHGDSAT